MTETEVCLFEMLDCRERRSQIQNTLLNTYHCPVISFSMNIPGPIKTNQEIQAAFLCGKEALLKEIREFLADEPVEFHEKTGDELLAAVRLPGEQLKKITTSIEDTHPFGRLFDMDVIDTDGQKLSRSTFRKCMICGCQAQECARMRRHSVKEMQAKTEEILKG